MNNPALVLKIKEWIIGGFSRTKAYEMIRKYSPDEDYTNAECSCLYNEAKKIICDTPEIDIGQLISVHIGVYEQIFNYFKSIGKLDSMNKALRNKERLIGLANSGNKIIINQKTTIDLSKNVQYDENRLSPSEKIELNGLKLKINYQPLQIAQPTQILQIAENVIETVMK